MDLSVLHDNAQAIALYQKLGFQNIPVFAVKRRNAINEALFSEGTDRDGLNPYARQTDNWLVTLRQMIESGDFPNLWTDVSYTLFQSEAFLPFLRLFLSHPRLRARTLFGSDFYMTRQEDLSERAMAVRLRAGLGEDLFRQIAETKMKDLNANSIEAAMKIILGSAKSCGIEVKG